jgi:outer membrane protein assembly factor BamB
MPSRRDLLAALGTVAATGVAGCGARADDPPPSDPRTPDPTRHVAGANGEWSSVGANPANTRESHEGTAPVDGVSERWRVDVGRSTAEPIVAEDTVFLSTHDGLRAFEAETGERRWTFANETTPPVVRNGRVFVGTGTALRSLDAASGEVAWSREFPATVGEPAAAGDGWLVVPVGEQLHRLDPRTGDTVWSADLFGHPVGSAGFYAGSYPAVATEAGEVSLYHPDGTGWGRWRLPSTPVAPPTVGTDSLYLPCRDGRIYALGSDAEINAGRNWSQQTGWGHAALSGGLVCVADDFAVTAIEAESGEQRWRRPIAEDGWGLTAPAFGRETLFVGGDRLQALDPSSSGLIGGGPAVRFEHDLGGPVGPGPVLDDGVLYTACGTIGERELVALA